MEAAAAAVLAPEGRQNWTALIDDVTAGRWIDPDTGARAQVPWLLAGRIVVWPRR